MNRHSIAEIKARADEFADAFENYEPQLSDKNAPLPAIMAAKLAAWRHDIEAKESSEAVKTTHMQRLYLNET